jgi:hypothetical protein
MTEELTTMLRAAAEAFDPPPAPDPAAVVTRARRRRGAQRAAGAGFAVLALLGTVMISIRAEPAREVDETTAQPATAQDLSRYRWSDLPAAPIDPRNQAALAWTGREMVVWGGVAGEGQLFGDGAAFDPSRSAWRRIATPSGVPSRFGAFALWTVTELLVVGGQSGVAPAGPGGAYDPAADRWRPLPPGPSDTERLFGAVWTGREAVVINAQRSASAYDPATDRWRSLAPLPGALERKLIDVVPVWAGDQLLVLALWTHSDISPVTGSGTITSGIDLYSLDPVTGGWTHRPGNGERLRGNRGAYWTGADVVIPAADSHGRGPAGRDLHGFRYDPATDTYTAMAHGPLDDGGPESYWTGTALISISHSIVTGPEPIDDRNTAAWDPATDRWTRLERAPAGVTNQTPLVWTGTELLSYGAQPARFGR